MNTLNSFALIKKKYDRGNQMPFMTKNLSKEIMARSRLRNRIMCHNPGTVPQLYPSETH